MKCPACNAIIPSDSDICPACFSPIETAQEPLAPPPPAATRANPREVENQSEASWKTQEGHRQAPPRENTVRGNTEGRFSARVPRKGLFLAIGILAVIIIAVGGYMTMNRQAPVPPTPVAKEQPAPAPEKPEEANPAPVHQEKKTVVKKAPKASVPKVQTPAPAPTPKAWTYRPDPVPPKPAPKPQAQRNGIGAWLDRTLGPEKPVTQPSNDPRYTGQ